MGKVNRLGENFAKEYKAFQLNWSDLEIRMIIL